MEYRQLPQEEYADLSSRILYEDNHLLVVDKKAGEITQGDNPYSGSDFPITVAKRDEISEIITL